MTMKKTLAALAMIFLVAGAFTSVRLAAADPVLVFVKPLKFNGQVSIHVRPDAKWLNLGASVHAGARPAPEGIMTLMGQRAKFASDWYNLRIGGATPRAGGPITLTFQRAVATAAPGRAGANLCTGSAVAPVPIRYTTPANDAHIAVAGPGSLTVSWNGGNPPYRVMISKSGGDRVITEADFAGTRLDVPLSIFAAGNRYLILISDAKRPIVFDRPVDPASNLSLLQVAGIYFYAD